MSSEATVLTAEFPKAVRGYSQPAVDDFVRQIGDRLDTLQDRLNDQIARGDRLQDELQRANATLTDYREKEAAIAGALLVTEQQRLNVRRELEAERDSSRTEAEQIVSRARAEADSLLDDARHEAGRITEASRAEQRTIEDRIIALSERHDAAMQQVRETLASLASSLPAPGSVLATSASGIGFAAILGTAEQLAEAA